MYADINTNTIIEKSLGKLLVKTSIQLKSFFDKSGYRKFIWDPSKINWIYKDINFFMVTKN